MTVRYTGRPPARKQQPDRILGGRRRIGEEGSTFLHPDHRQSTVPVSVRQRRPYIRTRAPGGPARETRAFREARDTSGRPAAPPPPGPPPGGPARETRSFREARDTSGRPAAPSPPGPPAARSGMHRSPATSAAPTRTSPPRTASDRTAQIGRASCRERG